MIDEATRAAKRLLEILKQENDALRRSDYAAATAVVADKAALIEGLSKALALVPRGEHPRSLAALGGNLHELASENQALLEQAINVQASVVRLVAKAAAPKTGFTRYTRFGSLVHVGKTPPVTLSAEV